MRVFRHALICLNIYSEYILSSDIIQREFSFGNFGNFGNFLVPSLNQTLLTFTPFYYNFMYRFGGYLLTDIQIGYSSIYILIFVCFNKNFSFFYKNRNIKFLLIISIIFFILTQTPS